MTGNSHPLSLDIRRRYPHPVEKVYRAWTAPDRIKRWWGPKDFTATSFEGDFREGGRECLDRLGEGLPRPTSARPT